MNPCRLDREIPYWGPRVALRLYARSSSLGLHLSPQELLQILLPWASIPLPTWPPASWGFTSPQTALHPATYWSLFPPGKEPGPPPPGPSPTPWLPWLHLIPSAAPVSSRLQYPFPCLKAETFTWIQACSPLNPGPHHPSSLQGPSSQSSTSGCPNNAWACTRLPACGHLPLLP